MNSFSRSSCRNREKFEGAPDVRRRTPGSKAPPAHGCHRRAARPRRPGGGSIVRAPCRFVRRRARRSRSSQAGSRALCRRRSARSSRAARHLRRRRTRARGRGGASSSHAPGASNDASVRNVGLIATLAREAPRCEARRHCRTRHNAPHGPQASQRGGGARPATRTDRRLRTRTPTMVDARERPNRVRPRLPPARRRATVLHQVVRMHLATFCGPPRNRAVSRRSSNGNSASPPRTTGRDSRKSSTFGPQLR